MPSVFTCFRAKGFPVRVTFNKAGKFASFSRSAASTSRLPASCSTSRLGNTLLAGQLLGSTTFTMLAGPVGSSMPLIRLSSRLRIRRLTRELSMSTSSNLYSTRDELCDSREAWILVRVYCAAVQLSGQKQFRPVSSAAYMTIKQVAVQAITGFKLEGTTHVSVTHELNINTQTYCTRSKHHNHAVLLLDYFSPNSVLICNQFCQLSQRRQARQVLQLVALDKEAPEPCQTLQLQGLEGCEPIASRMQITQVR